MGIGDIAASAVRPAVAEVRRRALLVAFLAIGAIGLVIELTIAATIALEPSWGMVGARLIVASFYALVMVVALIVFLLSERGGKSYVAQVEQAESARLSSAPADERARITLIAEALYLGYSLARRARREMNER